MRGVRGPDGLKRPQHRFVTATFPRTLKFYTNVRHDGGVITSDRGLWTSPGSPTDMVNTPHHGRTAGVTERVGLQNRPAGTGYTLGYCHLPVLHVHMMENTCCLDGAVHAVCV